MLFECAIIHIPYLYRLYLANTVFPRVRISKIFKISSAIAAVENRRAFCFCRACTCQELHWSCVCDARCAQLHIAHDGNGIPTAVSAVVALARVKQPAARTPIEMRFDFIIPERNRRIGRPPGRSSLFEQLNVPISLRGNSRSILSSR